MAGSRKVTIEILGDAKGFDRSLGKTTAKMGLIGGAAAKMGSMVADAALQGARAIGEFAAGSITAASDMNETVSKVGVLFGDSAGKVEDFAANSATAFGQSKQAALDAAATFATFGKGAGLTGDDLAGFSTQLTGLASDMASFSNSTPEEAVTAIGAALRGESEPIRQFGVLLDDATLRAEALKLGLVETTSQALTPQQKVLAAQAAILKQTGDAQGDFARTSGGLANQQRILSAQVDNLQAGLGQMLLPVVLWLTKAMNALIPVLSSVGGWIKQNSDWLVPLATVLGTVVGAIYLVTKAMKAWAAIQVVLNTALVANPIGLVIVAIAALVAGVIIAYKKVGWFRAAVQAMGRALVAAFNWIKQAANTLWGVMKTVFSWTPLGIVTKHFGAIVSFFKSFPGKVRSAFGTLATIMTAPFRAAFNAIASLWNNTVGKISFTVPSWVPKIGGNGFSMPQIPTMAEGGIVTSPTLAIIGEAGPEAVVPLSNGRGRAPAAGGNLTVNVYPRGSVLASKKEIADAVLDALKSQRVNGRALGLT